MISLVDGVYVEGKKGKKVDLKGVKFPKDKDPLKLQEKVQAALDKEFPDTHHRFWYHVWSTDPLDHVLVAQTRGMPEPNWELLRPGPTEEQVEAVAEFARRVDGR